MQNPIPKIQKKIKENSHKFYLAAAGIATLGATYYAGKTKGKTSIDLYLVSKTDAGDWHREKLSAAKHW